MEFLSTYKITAIQTKGRNDANDQWVKSYKVSYSSNMIDWKSYTDKDGIDKVMVTFLICRAETKYCNEGKILIHIQFFMCKVFTANNDRNTVVTNYLEPPIIGARYVRIQPQDWNVHISLRFEILGCDYQGKETIKWMVLSIIICFLITLYIPIT